jgi:hypothetical protein
MFTLLSWAAIPHKTRTKLLPEPPLGMKTVAIGSSPRLFPPDNPTSHRDWVKLLNRRWLRIRSSALRVCLDQQSTAVRDVWRLPEGRSGSFSATFRGEANSAQIQHQPPKLTRWKIRTETASR